MMDRAPAPPAPAPREASNPIRVLVAEDVDVNRELIRIVLTGRGYRVDEVENGERALDAIASSAYDVVLMDVQMPIMDGMQATRAVRAMGDPFTDLPVIALSAYAMPEQIDLCLQAGMTAHLAKPFTSEALCQTVAHWATRPKGVQASVIATLVRQAGSNHIEHLLRLLLTQLDTFAACNADDRRHLQAQAHALRGSASLFGFKALAAASRTLEDGCRMSQPVNAALEETNRLIVLVHEDIAGLLSAGLAIGLKASMQA
jgi:CheY-like chemotaxis protein/HPt (histidine-containing phosphotransfer) domain-containing protein